MKAIVQERYGSPDVLELRDVDRPEIGENDVLVKVRAASVNQGDSYLMTGLPYIVRLGGSGMGFGFRGPKNKIPGKAMSGEVEAIGANATRFQPGDEVYGEIDSGAFAEYVAVPEGSLALKPASLSFEEAAAVPLAGTTALQGLRDVGGIQSGQRVLILGASGGVGSYTVQIAKAFGAHVTGVCSTRHMEFVKSIGADHVIDYTREDFSRGEQKYDLIFQVAGSRTPLECRRALTPTGTLVVSSGQGNRLYGPLGRMLSALISSLFVRQRLRVLASYPDKDDLDVLAKLIEDRQVVPIIERTYPLNEAPEAMRYFQTGHAQAKVVITV
jgi:NADPH:quinone reductase-like Zn-dependent oxidoreductase